MSLKNPENKTFVRPLLDGRVIVVSREDEANELLVKMHAGLWATCYDLTGMWAKKRPYVSGLPV